MFHSHETNSPVRGLEPRALALGRFRPGAVVLALFGLVFALQPAVAEAKRQSICDPDTEKLQLHLDIGADTEADTGADTVVVDLFEDAAPRSLRQFVEALGDPPSEDDYLAGATFNYTRPHSELRLTAATGKNARAIDVQLDAAALGLNTRKIKTTGEAMQVLQRELLVAFANNGKRVEPGSKLGAWLRTWYETRDPSFLVGVSRQEVNEALGYRYESGLASRAVERGTVALLSTSPTEATPALTFFLRDIPERTGRVMVIGKVVEGLDHLEKIALRPRAPGAQGHKYYRPAEAESVKAVRTICQPLSS